jgi:CubicO group peptidase (beta-lactamase class C family)
VNWDRGARARLKDLLDRAVDARLVPGAVVFAGEGEETVWRLAVGDAEVSTERRRPMREDTIFDLASLTKVVATLPLVLGLVEEGHLLLTDRVADYLPEFRGEGKEEVTIGHLLSHSGGLLWHREFFRTLSGPEVIAAAAAEPLTHPAGTRAVYSDLGYMLLGEIVARVLAEPLAEAARRRVFEPLGMRDTGYLPGPDRLTRVAATETLPGRSGPKVGVVHDDNAEAMGGVAGHAGLFAPAVDLARYAAMWVARPPALLSPAARRRAFAPPPPARRGLGWVLRGDAMDVSGDLWPETSVGHTGFTGTSLTLDPVSGAWAVILTNRVHFGRERDIGPLRRRLHNVIAGAWRE